MKESYDYAVIRIVPRVDREEFINVGVILYSRVLRFLDAAVSLEPSRLASFSSALDVPLVRAQLEGFVDVCRGGKSSGPIGELPQSERFHWLTSPRSTIVQTSAVHSGVCDDPQAALEHLMRSLVYD